MYYSLIGLLALFLLLITNHDVILKKAPTEAKTQSLYRKFIFSVMAYYVTDILWGLFDAFKLNILNFADTELYFVAMAFSVFFWTQFANAYLGVKTKFQNFLRYVGLTFFIVVTLLVVLNLCYPILFSIENDGTYKAAFARYVVLGAQIVIFFLTALNALLIARRTDGERKSRHITIGLSGSIMLIFISIQIAFPNLPLYTIALMLGNALLRTFVVEGEKTAYREELEVSLQREKQQLKTLKATWELAYTDALTGAKSKLAYAEKEDEIDKAILNGTLNEIAVAVFDVNELKRINDTKGHDVGDKYIVSAYRLICDCFKNSEVFRIGGDEFVAILEGPNYRNRRDLLEVFDHRIEENKLRDKVVVSAGVAEYNPMHDNSYKRIFERADRKMYIRKDQLKAMPA